MYYILVMPVNLIKIGFNNQLYVETIDRWTAEISCWSALH